MFLNLIFNSLATAYILEVWFKTNALIEYAVILKLTNLFYINQYVEIQKNNYNENYISFLNEYHNCFFVRLISCPTCLSFWFSFLSCSLESLINLDITIFYYIFAMSFVNLFFYRILTNLS